MPKPLEIAVYMPDAQAAQFLLFQEHYDVFTTMLASGMFDVKNGNVTLHFDHLGVLQNIQRNDSLYSRKHA